MDIFVFCNKEINSIAINFIKKNCVIFIVCCGINRIRNCFYVSI